MSASSLGDNTVLPVHLAFKNLKVELNNNKILDDISGSVKPGELLAVMGPSGSGKTTLLNFLAGREAGDTKTGDVLLNGKQLNKKLKRKICYVLQEDIFFENVTLKETLMYSALLRLPEKMARSEKLAKVDEIIKILGLEKCANTKIGNSLSRGLSGGEKKRANIGCELITNPSLIFLDEPTSGLDSSNAFNLIKTLQDFAVKKSKTVVTTIHQPSSQIFYLFDKLLLMVSGKVAYYGKACNVLDFFKRAGFECDDHYNPADFILEVLSSGPETEEKIVNACKEWLKGTLTPVDNEMQPSENGVVPPENGVVPSKEGEEPTKENEVTPPPECGVDNPVVLWEDGDDSLNTSTGQVEITVEPKTTMKNEMTTKKKAKEAKWPTSFRTQFFVLCHRTFKQSLPVILSKLTWTQNIALSIILGLLWFQIPHEEETIRDRTGLLFFFTVYWTLNPMFRALLAFPAEEAVIKKERSAGMYRLSAYFLSKVLSEIPLLIFQPFVFLLIFYWMCGLNPSVAFLGQALNVITGTILSQSVGMAIGASVMNFERAIVLAAVSMLGCMLLGGFYVEKIPSWLSWLQYFSFINYAFENALILEFTGIKEHSCSSINTNFKSCGSNITSPVITGEEILTSLGVTRSFGENYAILLLFITFFQTFGYCSLRFFHKPK